MKKLPQIYCDLDGVLVDFESGILSLMEEIIEHPSRWPSRVQYRVKAAEEEILEIGKDLDMEALKMKNLKKLMYTAIEAHPTYWIDLKPLENGRELWSYIEKYNPIILSSPVLSDPKCIPQKTQWVKKYLGLDNDRCIITPNKSQYAVNREEKINNILIDDTVKKIDAWTMSGGIGILHKDSNVIKTISTLQLLNFQ